ncbi:MAG: queuosine precursor transporter [Ignavibacteriales bacterium]|nr:queuosine precursor transporter [Ignavibacteriales bacterium]
MHSVYKHLDTITGLFIAVLLISNVASTKIVDLGIMTFDGGTLLFPLSYIFGDILTEVYGYARSRKVIWLGFFSAALMAGTIAGVGALPAAGEWTFQESYDTVLGLTPRIVAASLVAFWMGEFSNSVVLACMKVATNGRHLWARTIGSTLIGQGLDTVVFVLLAFGGTMSTGLLAEIVVSNYLFKCGVEILFTPVTYATAGWLKKTEGIDWYDRGTNFNPFRTSLS